MKLISCSSRCILLMKCDERIAKAPSWPLLSTSERRSRSPMSDSIDAPTERMFPYQSIPIGGEIEVNNEGFLSGWTRKAGFVKDCPDDRMDSFGDVWFGDKCPCPLLQAPFMRFGLKIAARQHHRNTGIDLLHIF